MALEIIKAESPERRAEAFRVLGTVYGDANGWVKDVECRAIVEAQYSKLLIEANQKEHEFIGELNVGSGHKPIPGFGPQAMEKQLQLEVVKSRIKHLETDLKRCGLTQ